MLPNKPGKFCYDTINRMSIFLIFIPPTTKSVDTWLGKIVQSHYYFPFTLIIMKLHIQTPHEWKMCPMDFGVKGQIIAFPFHLSSWNFIQRLPRSRGCSLWVSGSKVERSRSKCIDYLKWLLVHNCFPFTSAFIKLHTQISSESRICPNDIGIKAWIVWIGCCGGGGGGGVVFFPLRTAPF